MRANIQWLNKSILFQNMIFCLKKKELTTIKSPNAGSSVPSLLCFNFCKMYYFVLLLQFLCQEKNNYGGDNVLFMFHINGCLTNEAFSHDFKILVFNKQDLYSKQITAGLMIVFHPNFGQMIYFIHVDNNLNFLKAQTV